MFYDHAFEIRDNIDLEDCLFIDLIFSSYT